MHDAATVLNLLSWLFLLLALSFGTPARAQPPPPQEPAREEREQPTREEVPISELRIRSWAERQELLLAQTQPLRVDTFDKQSNRTGHVIVDPKTGRFDSFDLRSNRQGHGYISPAPGPNTTQPSDVQLFDRNGQRVKTK